MDSTTIAPLSFGLTEKPNRKPRQKSAKRLQQEQADIQDGLAHAKAWLDETHPALIKASLETVGEKYDWRKDCWPMLRHDFSSLHDQIDSRGKTYWRAFISEVRRHWDYVEPAWIFVMYQRGIDEGRRWVSEIAPPELVERLRLLFSQTPQTVLPAPWQSDDENQGFPSPAHKLVVTLLGDSYPRLPCLDEDYLPEIEADCKAFRDFWQPFVEEAMDRVQAVDSSRTSKLNNPNYIGGFIEGACGHSEAIARKFTLGRRQ